MAVVSYSLTATGAIKQLQDLLSGDELPRWPQWGPMCGTLQTSSGRVFSNVNGQGVFCGAQRDHPVLARLSVRDGWLFTKLLSVPNDLTLLALYPFSRDTKRTLDRK